jgi:hypothetical protein
VSAILHLNWVKNILKFTSVPGCSVEWEILLVFDPWRSAVLLVAGDKSGQWKQWYQAAIPQAEQAYDDYLAERQKEMGL